MNHRQRFIATMHYQPRDRSPLYDFNFWDETLPTWQAQSLPADINRSNAGFYFGLDQSLGSAQAAVWHCGLQAGLLPGFEARILEDDGDVFTEVQYDGVIVRRQRSSVSIPMHVGHTLVDRDSWNHHYKPRLDPDTPGRFPEDWEQRAVIWRDQNRPYPIFIEIGSLFGWIRDWMGIENLAMVVYDDPAWFEHMIETIADLQIANLRRLFATGGRFEAACLWEDMCYNAGPLISPTHFRQFLVPHYRRITELLHANGVDIVWVDCDGRIDDLIPLWLDAGVNCMMPVEIGTWGADPVRYRREFGRDLRMMGGFDKHILAGSKSAIRQEIQRLAPLVEEGGFIGFADHRVPPNVPLEHYAFYCQTARQIWGRDTDLPPMPAARHLG